MRYLHSLLKSSQTVFNTVNASFLTLYQTTAWWWACGIARSPAAGPLRWTI